MAVEEDKPLIVVVDDEPFQIKVLERWLSQRDYRVRGVNSGRACLDLIHDVIPDAVCLDVKMPKMDGLDVLKRLKTLVPQVPVIMLTADEQVETVVSAMQLGAYDYLNKPIVPQKLLAVIQHAVQSHQMAQRLVTLEREQTTQETSDGLHYGSMVSQAESMKRVFRQVDRVVKSDISVLVRGESGTGKELIARAIHDHSGRSDGPFIAVNCGAIPESLQESAFFGHEKGAFTGAQARKVGKIEQAHGGTLFLDEIGEMPLALQASLLRALQERTIVRVGGREEIAVDFRLIAATNRQLLDEVEAGRFREDLYYRVAVFELELPALRQRREDVLLLANYFIRVFAKQMGMPPVSIDAKASAALTAYDWPGNIRQLKNAMQRALVVVEDGCVQFEDLPPAMRHSGVPADAPVSDAQEATGDVIVPTNEILPLQEVERRAIVAALRYTDGNASETARLLGISRATLYRKFKVYDLQPEGS